jgi:hypothetical protein
VKRKRAKKQKEKINFFMLFAVGGGGKNIWHHFQIGAIKSGDES